MLFLHLLPDRVNTLRTPLHVVVQTGSLQLLVEGLQEPLDIGIAAALCLVQLLLDMIVSVVLEVFQAKVLQLAFEFVEAELVCQRSIEIGRLHCHLSLCLDVLRVLDLSHDADAVGNHDEDDAHVFRKSDEQAAEVVASHRSTLGVHLADAHQAVQDMSHFFAKVLTHFLDCGCTALDD